jgi:hypothetical protein
MKNALAMVLFVFTLAQSASASADNLSFTELKLADSTTDACIANCANQNAACKRVCPTTLSTPCLMACDSQAQICRESCRPR